MAALAVAGPAQAHTGISVDPARAGAKNAVAHVNAEAESQSAGVTKVQIYLPIGIAPADITAISLPKQWKLTKQESSYTVEGPALKVGTNAEHRVRIRQLPTYASITFRVLQSYSDGRTDRWIGEESDDNPAPVVKLAGGSGAAPESASPSASPSPSGSPQASTSPTSAASEPSATTPVAAPPAADDSGSNTPWWIAGGVLILLLAGGGVALARRGRSQPPA